MSHDPSTSPMKKFEEEVAITRGMNVLDTIDAQSRGVTEHHAAKKKEYLNKLYLDIHKALYQDIHSLSIDGPQAGMIEAGEKRANLRQALDGLAAKLFDENGFMKTMPKESLAGVLSSAYQQLHDIKPFAYGNEESLNLFITACSHLPGFKDRYPEQIDFRRLDEADLASLHEGANAAGLKKAFLDAMDFSRTPRQKDGEKKFESWGDHSIRIEGVPFLEHEQQGKKYLVTMNGGLVEKTDAFLAQLREHILSDKQIVSFTAKPDAWLDVEGQQLKRIHGENGENGEKITLQTVKLKNQSQIDGIPCSETAAPLLCLDMNLMTGLRPARHDWLLGFLQKDNVKLTSLADPAVLEKMLARTDLPTESVDVLKMAAAQAQRMVEKINLARDHELQGKTATEHKHLMMPMGGAGSGKTAAEELMRGHVGDNYVKASLDEARNMFDTLHVLRQVGHHADDYITVETVSNALRDWTADRARERGLNVLYDGTGIAYGGRYDKILENFKNVDYHTTVCAVDTLMTKDSARDAECENTALERISERFSHIKRALPWTVVTGKHIKTFASFMDAVRDMKADKVVLMSNDGAPGQHYIVAETFDQNPADWVSAKNVGALQQKMAAQMQKDPESAARILAHAHAGSSAAQQIEKIPAFDESNVGVLGFYQNGKDRVLAISNVTRMIDVAQKAQLNANAASQESLTFKSDALAGSVARQREGITHIQPHIPGQSYQEKIQLRRTHSEQIAALSA